MQSRMISPDKLLLSTLPLPTLPLPFPSGSMLSHAAYQLIDKRLDGRHRGDR